MRSLAATFALLLTLLVVPSAEAAPGPSSSSPPLIVSPLSYPTSGTLRPPGFSTDGDQAIAAAKSVSSIQALHRREHPLHIRFAVWIGGTQHWEVGFAYHGQQVAEVDVSRTGRVLGAWTGPASIAPYAHGHYAPIFDSPWVVVPFSLLFLLPFLDLRRLRRLAHLDALMVLSFLVSYALLDHGHLESAVWLAYPPLLYLLWRMLRLGGRCGDGSRRVSPLLSTKVLATGLFALVAARTALGLVDSKVLDVGYASVLGAHRISHGLPLYYANSAHADTYGPIAYLAYVPFELLFPWKGRWDYVASAHAASLVFDLVTVGGLIALGRRMLPGREGKRLGLALGWAWAACPFTLLALMEHTNDGLIAMLSVLSLLVFASPAARGAMIGLAAAAKFSPAALLPLYAGRDIKTWKGRLTAVGCFIAVVALAVGIYLPSGGLHEFYQRTIGYQLSRSDVFSPWALHPALDPLKLVLAAGALLLAMLVAFVPRRRSLVQVAALAGAVTIAVQIPAVHWFYYYIVWFAPFVFVALLAPAPASEMPSADRAQPQTRVTPRADEREPALVTA